MDLDLETGREIEPVSQDERLKAIAHFGKMLIQSQHDDTQINAERDVTVTASQGKITTAADQQIVWMTAGGAYIKLEGGNFEMGAPGGCTIKAAKHVYVGPASKVPMLPQFSGLVCLPCLLAAQQSGSPFVAPID